MSEDKTEAVMCAAMITFVSALFCASASAPMTMADRSRVITLICRKSTDTEEDARALFSRSQETASELLESGVEKDIPTLTATPVERSTLVNMLASLVIVCSQRGIDVDVASTVAFNTTSLLVNGDVEFESVWSEAGQIALRDAEEIDKQAEGVEDIPYSDGTPEIEVELEAADS